MALPATETFTDTDGTVLTTHSASWSLLVTATTIIITSNAARASTAATAPHYWNADGFANNQYSQARFAAVDTATGTVYVLARATGLDSTRTYYFWKLADTGSTAPLHVLGKVINSTSTTLFSDTVGIVLNDIFRIEANGTSISGLINGSAYTTQTDSAIVSGSAGISTGLGNAGVPRLDDWEGGNLSIARPARRPGILRPV